METPIGRVFILPGAFLAHVESRHARHWTVVGQVFDDRKARSAICAVGEWIAIVAVFGVKQLAQTFLANSHVW